MEDTLGKQYPNWWKQYQDSNAVYGITKNSSAIANFLSKHYTKPVISDAGKILFGNALAKGASGIAKLGIATASVATGAKAVEIVNRVMRSPTLRKYYQNVIKASAARDGTALISALEKFDEESIKEEKINQAKKELVSLP